MYTNVEMIGRLTRDPELRKTGNDTSVTNFSVAVNREFKNDEVDFFDITAWKQLAELVAGYKKKGDLVFIQGKLRQDRFEKDGQTRTKVYVVANTVVFLPSNNDSANTSSGDNGNDVETDDIPF